MFTPLLHCLNLGFEVNNIRHMCWNEFLFAQKTSRKQFLSMSLTSRKYLDHVCCYLKPLKPKWGNLQASCKMKFDENLGYCTKLNPPETWLINLVKQCTYSSILQVRLFHSMNGSEAYTQFSHILHVFLAYTLLKIFPIVNRTKWFVDSLKINIRVLDFLWTEVYTIHWNASISIRSISILLLSVEL